MEGEEELVYEYQASFPDNTLLEPNLYNIKSFDSFPKDFFDDYNKKKHPLMAEISLPVLNPTTGKYCIGFRKSGVTLEEYAHDQRRNFCDMHLIKEPYQCIIIDLLYLSRHLSEQNFEANLDGNITVSTTTGSRKPMIVLVDVGTTAMGKRKKSLWEHLATFLQKINVIIEYNPGPNTEMATFIRYLNAGCRAPSKKESHNYLASLPLFWTPTERRIFVGDHWDLTKKTGRNVAVYGDKPVYTNKAATPADWRALVETELRWLVQADGGLAPVMPFKNARKERLRVEEETRAASSFARSWLVHTEEKINKLQVEWGAEDTRVTSQLQNEHALVETKRKAAEAADAYTFGIVAEKFDFRTDYEKARDTYQMRRAQHDVNRAFYGDFNAVKLHRKFEQIFPQHVERLWPSAKTLQDILMPHFRSSTDQRPRTLLVPLRQELIDGFGFDIDLPDE